MAPRQQWKQQDWRAPLWTQQDWDNWYYSWGETTDDDVGATHNHAAVAEWSPHHAAVADWSPAEWSPNHAAVEDWSPDEFVEPSATAPDENDENAPADSRPQPTQENDAATQQVDEPTQEAQPAAVAEANAGADVAPAAAATNVQASESIATPAAKAAVLPAGAAQFKAPPFKSAPPRPTVTEFHAKAPPAKALPAKAPPAPGREPAVVTKATVEPKAVPQHLQHLVVENAPAADAQVDARPAQADQAAPPAAVAEALQQDQVAAPPGLPKTPELGDAILNEEYFNAYRWYSDSCRQHNAAAKWLREYCKRENLINIDLPTHSSVEVRDVLHDDHGPGFSFAESKRNWHWHELIAQLESESMHKVCGDRSLEKCTFAIRRGNKTPTNHNLWDFIITRNDGTQFALHPEWNGLKIPARDMNQGALSPPPPQSRPAGMRYCDQTKSAWAKTRSKSGTIALRFDKYKNPRVIEARQANEAASSSTSAPR